MKLEKEILRALLLGHPQRLDGKLNVHLLVFPVSPLRLRLWGFSCPNITSTDKCLINELTFGKNPSFCDCSLLELNRSDIVSHMLILANPCSLCSCQNVKCQVLHWKHLPCSLSHLASSVALQPSGRRQQCNVEPSPLGNAFLTNGQMCQNI